MVGAYGTYGKKKNAYRISVGKPKRSKEINRLKDLGEYGRLSKWIAKKTNTGGCRLDYYASGQGLL
jgi:hypothetical protein